MKLKIIATLTIFLFSISAFAGRQYRCLYVLAEKGADIYETKKVKSKTVKHLDYGELVQVEEYTAEYASVKYKGKTKVSRWLKVKFEGNKEGEEPVVGYMPEMYLAPYLQNVPPLALAEYNFIELENNIALLKNTLEYNYYTNDGNGTGIDSASCGCFSYYRLPLQTEVVFNHDNTSEPIEISDNRLDTINYYLQIETIEIEKYRNRKINNPYEIDTTAEQVAVAPINDDIYRLVEPFYLLLDGGKDSLLVNEHPGEYGTTQRYAGTIKGTNKYLLELVSFFGNNHTLVDKTTGEKTDFTDGSPLIAPDGKFAVDFYESYDYELQEIYGTVFTVSVIGTHWQPKQKLRVQFRSFLLMDGDFTPFWVSGNEVVIKVYPIDNFIFGMCSPNNITETKGQYLKIKIHRKNFID